MKRLINRLTTLTAMLAVAVAVSCSKDTPPSPGTGTGEGVELRFTASISDDFGGAQAQTKAPVVGKTFPAGVHRLSLAIFQADKATLWAAGYENVLAEVNVNNTGTQTWRFQLKGSSVWQSALSFPTGTSGDMWITALYPYDAAAGTTASGNASLLSNFNLTTTAQQANQSDMMYVPPTKLTIASDDLSRAVLLPFKHLFAMFEFQIAPIFNDASRITKISVQNGTSENWIANEGTAGTADNTYLSSYGDVSVTDTRSMTMGVYNTYRVLVPQPTLDFVSAYNDGDISIKFIDGLNTTVAPLPLKIKKEWLEATSGLKAGNRYTFKMLYHNNLVGEGKLEVSSWSVNGILIDGWGVGAPSDAMLYWSCGSLVKSGRANNGSTHTIADATQSSYNDFLYNASNANNNGGYKDAFADIFTELPFYQLEVAKTDESSDETWVNAWTLCALKTTDGGGWRLPRASELMLCLFNNAGLITADGYTDFASGEFFWSATERYAGNCWKVMPSTAGLTASSPLMSDDRAATYRVRCVRELPRKTSEWPAAFDGYLHWQAPGTLQQGTLQDDVAFTAKATTKSYNGYTRNDANANNNGGCMTTVAALQAEPVYYALEVAKTEEPSATWAVAWAACKAKSPAGEWRLPRASEVAWMYLNKTQLEQGAGFTPLTNIAYWTAVEHTAGPDSDQNAQSWTMGFSSFGLTAYPKLYAQLSRCVREL